MGIGVIWGSAGVGLVDGGILGHWLGHRLSFERYKATVSISFLIHGFAYILFALAPSIWISILFIAISRVAMGVNNVLNKSALLTHVPDHLRARVFTTVDTILNFSMTASLPSPTLTSQP